MDNIFLIKKLKKKISVFFTLIELLVVIAIIAILASILFPALKKAKDATYKTVCMGNLKQIACCLASYMSDFGGYVPMPWNGAEDRYWHSILLINNYIAIGGVDTSTPYKTVTYVTGRWAKGVLKCPVENSDKTYGGADDFRGKQLWSERTNNAQFYPQ